MNRKRILEIVAFEYLLLLGMLSRYIEYREDWRTWLLRLGALVLFISPVAYKIITKNWVLCAFLAIITGFFYLSVGIYGNRSYLEGNYRHFIYAFFCAAFIFWLSQIDINWLWRLLKKHFFVFNGFYIINLFIVILQLQNTGFLIKTAWLESNPFYTDQCAGLFGKSGTHSLALFSVFMLIYNLQISEEIENLKLKYGLIVYTYLSMLCSMYLSTKNENAAIFILYAFALVIYYAVKAYVLKWDIKILLRVLLPLALLFILFLLVVPQTHLFISRKLLGRLIKVTSGVAGGASGGVSGGAPGGASGSNEAAEINFLKHTAAPEHASHRT